MVLPQAVERPSVSPHSCHTMPDAGEAELINRWHRRAWVALNAHYDAARRRSAFDRWAGGLAALLSAIVAALVGSSLFDSSQMSSAMKWSIVIASAAAAGLTALVTRLEFGKLAVRHRAAATQYAAVARAMEEALLSSGERNPQLVADVRRQLDKLEEEAPPIPNRYRQKAKQAYKPLVRAG